MSERSKSGPRGERLDKRACFKRVRLAERVQPHPPSFIPIVVPISAVGGVPVMPCSSSARGPASPWTVGIRALIGGAAER